VPPYPLKICPTGATIETDARTAMMNLSK